MIRTISRITPLPLLMPLAGRRKRREQRPTETRTAEAITVAWMLATVAAFGSELLAIISFLLGAWSSRDDGHLMAISGALLYIAVITGVIDLVLAPIVQRLRRTPAPAAIFVFSLAVGAVPLLMLLVSAFVIPR